MWRSLQLNLYIICFVMYIFIVLVSPVQIFHSILLRPRNISPQAERSPHVCMCVCACVQVTEFLIIYFPKCVLDFFLAL